MSHKLGLIRVRVRFVDPDGLAFHFRTDEYLAGEVVALVPGPTETNWILRLDKPIRCYDVKGSNYETATFLLKPNGLDAETAMRQLAVQVPTYDAFTAMVMVLKKDSIPSSIKQPKEYKKYPMIGDVRILIDVKNSRA